MTDFLIVVDEQYLDQSKKLTQIKVFKRIPKVVHVAWLIDSLEKGFPIEDDNELLKFLVNAKWT